MTEDSMTEEAKRELKKYLLLKYGTEWNTPNEYWEAALHMTARALEAERLLKMRAA